MSREKWKDLAMIIIILISIIFLPIPEKLLVKTVDPQKNKMNDSNRVVDLSDMATLHFNNNQKKNK
jgi:hypothetical protein